MSLNPKQKRFCEEYVIDLNGTQAAIRAGYSAKTANEQASQLLAKLSIQEEISKLQKAISEKNKVTAEWVMNRFKEISERCMQAEPVMVYDREEKMMVPTGEYQFDSAGANKATEMLGKMIGVFEKDNSQKAVSVVTNVTRTIISKKV